MQQNKKVCARIFISHIIPARFWLSLLKKIKAVENFYPVTTAP